MKDLIRSILNIFCWLGKALNTTRIIILNLAFLFVILLLFSTFILHNSKTEVKSVQKGTLLLTLKGDIVEEQQTSDPFSDILNEQLGLNTLPVEILFQDILDAIAHAADDENISGILLELKGMGKVGLNQLQLIGNALTDFKASGKKVIAAEDYYSQKAYYLSSFADEIYLNPMGAVDLHGIGAFTLFFKDAIDKLKINYHIFRVGTYKSAIEPLVRNSMSAEAKRQNMSWLSPLWSTIVTDIVRERNLKENSLQKYTENIASELAVVGGDTARLALETGLVDGLKTREELRTFLIDIHGEDDDGELLQVSLTNYLETVSRSYINSSTTESSIGIIVAQGMILDGKQPIGFIGGDTMGKLIRQAREDDDIKGLVLRIVTGGGSVFASEVIRQEILEFKKTKKPLVVSMGTVAASGGYWIAADADEIWSSPVTITGSIGIFAAIPTFENSLSAMGIYNDGVGTTSLASSLNLTKSLHPSLKESIQISVNHGYDQFLGIVTEGRSMSLEQVQRASEGRVFDGTTALQLGLVDKLGTLADAVASASVLAGLDDYSAQYIRKPLTVKDEILQLFTGVMVKLAVSSNLSPSILAGISSFLQPVREMLQFNDPKGLYAHCLIHEISL